MSNISSSEFGRPKNDQKIRMYMRDNENTVMYTPTDYTGNKFFGTWNKALTLQTMLFGEAREKYYN